MIQDGTRLLEAQAKRKLVYDNLLQTFIDRDSELLSSTKAAKVDPAWHRNTNAEDHKTQELEHGHAHAIPRRLFSLFSAQVIIPMLGP
jgi:hypothetical protein